MCAAHSSIEDLHGMYERLLIAIIKKLRAQILLFALGSMLILAFTPPENSTLALIIFVTAGLFWIMDKVIEHRFRLNNIRSEEVRWDDDLSKADKIFEGLVELDMSKVANDGTTREIDEILDFRVAQSPNAARSLVKLFHEARNVAIDSPHDRKIKESAREFLACYFVTSGASTVRSLLLKPSVRKQLFASALADTNVYVRTQLLRALASTIQKSDSNACNACMELVSDFIKDENVLVSGYAYVFSKEYTGVGLVDLQRAWEKKYQDTEQYNEQYNLHGYLSCDNRRLRYIAAGLAGYVNDEMSKACLLKLTKDKYDYVRDCARTALARRHFACEAAARE